MKPHKTHRTAQDHRGRLADAYARRARRMLGVAIVLFTAALLLVIFEQVLL